MNKEYFYYNKINSKLNFIPIDYSLVKYNLQYWYLVTKSILDT